MIRQEKRLQSEVYELRNEVTQQKRLNDAGRMREKALESEVVELRNVVKVPGHTTGRSGKMWPNA